MLLSLCSDCAIIVEMGAVGDTAYSCYIPHRYTYVFALFSVAVILHLEGLCDLYAYILVIITFVLAT